MWTVKEVAKQQSVTVKYECCFCDSLSDTLITLEHAGMGLRIQRCFDCAKCFVGSTAENTDQLMEHNAAMLPRYEDSTLVDYLKYGVLRIHPTKQVPCLPYHAKDKFAETPTSTLLSMVQVKYPEIKDALSRFVENMS